MNYTKPEVAVLGQAVRVIESTAPSKNTPSQLDNGMRIKVPAYDLDE
ncbi:MAG: hypothetical protein ABR881_15170 [Candidatus Sulfotelmatobacter sp.]